MKYWAIILVFGVLSASGRQVSKEELAGALRAKNVDDKKIETYLCIVQRESNFETTAHNTDTGDHGIFQISQIYWCSPPGTGCGMSCDSMRDDDIQNDVDCALKVYSETEKLSGNGFTAWTTYQFCH